MTDFDNFMEFNGSDLSCFNETEQTIINSRIFNTNPVKFSKSEDKHYRCKLRLLYNVFNPKMSVISQVRYNLNDAQGLFFADSKLGLGVEHKDECPLFTSWKKLRYSSDEKKVEWGKTMYEKREFKWVLGQVEEDKNRPEMVGKFVAIKLPKAIWNKMEAKMNPSAESKKAPQPIMDYLFGPILNMDVVPGPVGNEQRQISYDLCDFDIDPYPIIKTDGTPLFSDEEIELIEKYNSLNLSIQKAKTQKVQNEKNAEKNAIKPEVAKLMSKAVEYMKANSFNIEDEVAFKEWSPTLAERVQKWIDAVAEMKDPRTIGVTITEPTTEPATAVRHESSESDAPDDLPF